MFNYLTSIIMTKPLALKEETKGRYACLLFDSTMKTVLGTAANEDLFIDIIEFLIPGKHISSLKLLNKEHHGFADSEKSVTFDLLCVDKDTGEEFEVEVQNAEEESYRDRMLYYSYFPIREQLAEKKKRFLKNPKQNRMDYSIKPVYMISLLNFVLEHDSDDALEDGYISRFEIRNGRNSEILTSSLNFVFVEMDRLPYTKDQYDLCKTRLERFIFSIKYMHTFEAFPEHFKDDPMLEKLANAAELANLSAGKLKQYEQDMITELDRQLQLEFAEKKGKKEGREEGREEGRAEGEERKSREIASRLIEMGMEIPDVSKATGLSMEQLEALRAK